MQSFTLSTTLSFELLAPTLKDNIIDLGWVLFEVKASSYISETEGGELQTSQTLLLVGINVYVL